MRFSFAVTIANYNYVIHFLLKFFSCLCPYKNNKHHIEKMLIQLLKLKVKQINYVVSKHRAFLDIKRRN